ncbi:hypothetical protein NBRC116583_25150 [Arenicella sp. 4NH20-0111]|uniref:GumC family protein n=1 Tax=Arenicella sp. 4NH20-0111 TaxID=3127648 RepID=UPI00310A72C4
MNWSLFLREFIIAAWQARFKIAVLFIFTVIASVCYFKYEKPKFKTSWVLLLPGTERASTINLDNLGEARSSGKNAYGSVSISPKNTYREIALSDAVIEQAASRFGVASDAFTKPRIKLIDQTPAMEFTLKGSSEEELRNRASLYNNTFQDILDRLRKNEIERNYKGVEGNLSEAKGRLRKAREAILEYQSNSNIVSDEQFQTWLNDSEELRTKQSDTEVRIASLEAKLQSKLNQLGLTPQQAEAFLLIQANPTTQSLMNILSEKLSTQASQQKIYGKQNPIRIQLDKEIAGIRSSLANNLISIPNLGSIKRPQLYGLLSKETGETLKFTNQDISELNGLRAEASKLIEQRGDYAARIREHATEAARLSDLNRNHQIAEAIFSSALAKLDTSRLDIYATYPLTQLLTQPGGTIKRDRLQAKLMIVALFMAFGFLALALIFNTLRSNHKVDDITVSLFNAPDQTPSIKSTTEVTQRGLNDQ